MHCCRFDTLMRYNTVLIKHSSCCHDFFTHRLRDGVHYLVNSSLLSCGIQHHQGLSLWQSIFAAECRQTAIVTVSWSSH